LKEGLILIANSKIDSVSMKGSEMLKFFKGRG